MTCFNSMAAFSCNMQVVDPRGSGDFTRLDELWMEHSHQQMLSCKVVPSTPLRYIQPQLASFGLDSTPPSMPTARSPTADSGSSTATGNTAAGSTASSSSSGDQSSKEVQETPEDPYGAVEYEFSLLAKPPEGLGRGLGTRASPHHVQWLIVLMEDQLAKVLPRILADSRYTIRIIGVPR